MSRSSPRKFRRRKSHQPFLEKGLNALILGAGLWLIPSFMSGQPLLSIKSNALQMLAWFLMGIGLLLLGIHFVLKDKAVDRERAEPKFAPQRPSTPAKPGTQREETAIWQTVTPETPLPNTASTALTEWSPAVFKAIEWRRFEAVCEVLFSQAGFEARTQSHGPDGGVDVWLHSKHAQGPALVVQCKHWRSKPVGVKEVREFFGVMASHQLKRGTYATTSTFTSDAVDFAKRNGIHLLDGKGLLKLIAQRTPEQQQVLLAVAFEGDYARPTCASCGIKMVKRTPSKGGPAFWGCTNYPRCRSRLGMIAS
jgi:restriction system protein